MTDREERVWGSTAGYRAQAWPHTSLEMRDEKWTNQTVPVPVSPAFSRLPHCLPAATAHACHASSRFLSSLSPASLSSRKNTVITTGRTEHSRKKPVAGIIYTRHLTVSLSPPLFSLKYHNVVSYATGNIAFHQFPPNHKPYRAPLPRACAQTKRRERRGERGRGCLWPCSSSSSCLPRPRARPPFLSPSPCSSSQCSSHYHMQGTAQVLQQCHPA